MNRFIYSLLTNGAYNNTFEGHIESSPYFGADICNKHIRYVRDFVFPEINTLKVCPSMPYYDSARPYVKAWFASSDGADVGLFAGMISEQNQDGLEREGGACIMYTHFASGFFRDGAIDPRFKNLIERLGRKNGWFVPVHVLLDHIAAVRGVCTIAPRQRMQMERRFLWNRTLHQLMDKLA